MSKPVNLNRVRKERTRNEARRVADENAVRYGRTKEEKAADAARAEIEARRLDAHKRDE